MTSQGYSGTSYDRYVERTDTSTFHKMKETYWTTKQAVMKKLGKKEDEHIVASDAALDAKLEVFQAIQRSSMELLRVIERYQDRLCALSQEENAVGRFLKSNSGQDKTQAGKIMAAVGKSQSFAAQQRLALRVPLVRLYQEVETFRYRAISDTLMTINRMESARTEYRGALMWMKAVSEELDPDTYKQLEKFRKVQAQVRKTKTRFDKLKLDVMQKIDLLAASRCNMFSHVLANYQSTLLHFWEKTSRTMSAVAESFRGYQHYEFSIIKELAEPSKKLAEDATLKEAPERDTAGEGSQDNSSIGSSQSEDSDDECIIDHDNKQTWPEPGPRTERYISHKLSPNLECISDLIFLFWVDFSGLLISLGSEESQDPDNSSLNNLYVSDNHVNQEEEKTNKSIDEEFKAFMEFEAETSQNDDDFDFSGKVLPLSKNLPREGEKDLLADDPDFEDFDKDDMTVLNEIMNAPSTGEDEFAREWTAVFGVTPLNTDAKYTPVESDKPPEETDYLPSHLLEQMGVLSMNQTSLQGGMLTPVPQGVPLTTPGGSTGTSAAQGPQPKQPKPKKGQKQDMSAWFNLFADLDPLSNPDAIGKTTEEMTDA
ncbi:hypothetical protein ScPMuIL_016955 [Solemya velum]